MDVFKYKKLQMQANDPTRRYELMRGLERDHVANVEIVGDPPRDNTLVVTVVCFGILSDAAREDALSNTRRFLKELVTGWGFELGESTESGWAEQPNGRFLARLEYAVG